MKNYFYLFLFLAQWKCVNAQYKLSSYDLVTIDKIKELIKSKELQESELGKYSIQQIRGDRYLSCVGKKSTLFDKKRLKTMGYLIGEIEGNITTLKIPLKEIDNLNLLQDFSHISLARKINYNLDKALIDTRVDSVHLGLDLPQSYSGKNVYIGVTDWGFDYTSPMFYDTSLSESRIVAAWDQYKTSGPTPSGFSYGTEYNDVQSLLQAQSDTSNIYSYATHGTHVAGIAGGSGIGTAYRGIAFDAKFLFCTFLVDEASVLDAWQWMYEKAQTDGKRLVINMSWGLYHMGTLDGSSLLSQAISTYTDLGVVFVNSGGNNGNVNFHLKKVFTESDTIIRSKVDFYSYASNPNMWGQSIHAWGENDQSFSMGMEVLNASNVLISETPLYSNINNSYVDSILIIGNDTIFYNVTLDSSNIFNQRPGIRFRIKNTHTGYKIIMKSTSNLGTVHFWNVTELTNDVGNWGMPFSVAGNGTTAGNNENGISEPSCSDDVISVAAYATQYQVSNGAWVGGARASFSSIGPRFDGVMKPDIAAPGVAIISSMSSFTDVNFTSMANVDFNGRTYHFAKLSGTSMSAPMVTGISALILEVNPYLTAHQVKEIIISSAREDNFTGIISDTGNVMWGYGKVNAYKAVQLAIETIGLMEIEDELDWDLFPNPCTEKLRISILNNNTKDAMIIDLSGELQFIKIQNGIIDIRELTPGKYILRLSIDGKIQQKTFIKI